MKKIGNSFLISQPLGEYLHLEGLPISVFITPSGLSLDVIEDCEQIWKTARIKSIRAVYFDTTLNYKKVKLRNTWIPFVIETMEGYFITASKHELDALEGIAEEWYNEQNYYHA